jgi:spoIIIJ-associated protein
MDVFESKGRTVDEAVFSGLVKMDLSIDEVDIEILDEGAGLFKSARVRLTRKPEEEFSVEAVGEPEAPPQPKKGFEEPFRPEPRGERSFERRDRRDSGRRDDFRPGGRRDEHRREDFRRDDRRPGDRPYSRPAAREEADEPIVAREPQNEAEKFLYGLFGHMRMNVALASRMEDGMLKVDMSGRVMGMLIGRRGETLDALQYLTSLVINNNKNDYTKVMLDTENYRGKREDTLKRLAAHLAEKVEHSGRRVVLEPMNPYERRILHATLQDYEKVYTYSEGEEPYRSVVVALKGKEDDTRPPEPVSRPNPRPRRHR